LTKKPEFLGVNIYETRQMVFTIMVKVKKRGDFTVFTKNVHSQMINWREFHGYFYWNNLFIILERGFSGFNQHKLREISKS